MAHSLKKTETAGFDTRGLSSETPVAKAARQGFGNDTSWIEARFPAALDRRVPVSVVIPVYNRKRLLARTLAALTHQSWPLDRIEVVIADDGSSDGVESVIARYGAHLNIRHVRQDDRGYRLSTVRNLAIRAASHDRIILLDCDVLPSPKLVESYMRAFAATDRAVLLGLRRFVDASGVTDAEILADPSRIETLPRVVCDNPKFEDFRDAEGTYDWRLDVYAETDRLVHDAHPYRCVVGATFAFSRAAFESVGGFCEEFEDWGYEDGEFGYRLQTRGYWFLPVESALGLHQEPEEPAQRSDRVAGAARTGQLAEELCPGLYRPRDDTRRYRVPTVSIVLSGNASRDDAASTIASLREQSWTDWDCTLSPTDPQARIPEDPRLRVDHEEHARSIPGGWSDSIAVVPRGATLDPMQLERMLDSLAESPALCAIVSSTGCDEPMILMRRRDASRLQALDSSIDLEHPRQIASALSAVGGVRELEAPPRNTPGCDR